MMRYPGIHLAGLFWLAAFLEAYILVTDEFLRTANPLQAYALAAFIGVDVAIASLLLGGLPTALRFPPVWASLQFVGLLLNPALMPPVGWDPSAFAHYLFGLWAYDALVACRAIQTMVTLSLGPLNRQGSRRAFLTRS